MTRSLTLQQKLAKHIQTKAWKVLLSDLPDLTVLAYDVTDRDFARVEARARDTWYIAAVPDSILRDTYDEQTNNAVVAAWMARALVDSNILGTVGKDIFYLRTETYYAAGWTEVRSENMTAAICTLFERLTNKVITIASADLTMTLAFRTTEHYWHAYWIWPVTMQQD